MVNTMDNALKAIRAKCLDCSGGQRNLVEHCVMHSCPLYPYRSLRAIGIVAKKESSNIKGQIDVYDLIAR